jgi:hypothetical protein
VLEGYPPAPSLIDELIARTGYSAEAFRTLSKHGELDPGHRDELDRALDGLQLTAGQETALGLNAISTTHMLARAIGEIVDEYGAG